MKIKFGKDGLVPMIIQDANSGLVLSLFYANEEAIEKMKNTGYVWRYSRAKKKLMKKGEESGNTQKIISITQDCDQDAFLVRVIPNGPACHKGQVSCFESRVSSPDYDFSALQELVQIIKERKLNPKDSYTSKIVKSREAIIEKLREECEELIEAEGQKDITWEAADLIYFTLVYLENREVEFSEVLEELRRRRKQTH